MFNILLKSGIIKRLKDLIFYMMKKITIKELKNEFKELKTRYAELGEEISRSDDCKSIEYLKFVEKLRRLDDILSIETDNRIGVKRLKKSVARFIDKNNLREAVLQSRQFVKVCTIGLMAMAFTEGFGLMVRLMRKKRGN